MMQLLSELRIENSIAMYKRYGWLRKRHAIAISALLKGKKKKPFTEAHKAALSAAHIGVKLSKEHTAASQKARKGVPYSAERLQQRLDLGYKHSAETIANIKAGHAKQGPEKKAELAAKHSAAQKGKPKNPESIAKMKASLIAKYQKDKNA